MDKKSLASALKRKIDFDEDVLSRIRPRKSGRSILMNPSRLKIFVFICNHPCSHFRAICRGTDFSTQNIKWHIGILLERGMVTDSFLGNRRIFTPLKDIIHPGECRILSALNKAHLREIFLYIEKHPGSGQKEMVKALNIYQQLLSRNLKYLVDLGLVLIEREGRKNLYHPAPKLGELEKGFEPRTKYFREQLLKTLENDGLSPTMKRSTGKDLVIELDIGAGRSKIIRINKNPFSEVKRSRKVR